MRETPVQLRWSTDGRVMPEEYAIPEGVALCDAMGDRCGSRRAYEVYQCRGRACRDTQREMGRKRRAKAART